MDIYFELYVLCAISLLNDISNKHVDTVFIRHK